MEETNSATSAPIEENRSQKAVESNQLGLKAVALYSYDKQDEDEVFINMFSAFCKNHSETRLKIFF